MTSLMQFYTKEDWDRLEADSALDPALFSVTVEHDGDEWIVNVCDWLQPSERPARDAAADAEGWRTFETSDELIAYMSGKGYPCYADSSDAV